MKREYTRPDIVFENFTLSTAIAGTCGSDPERSIGCRAGSSSFWLTWDGRMLPCG